MKVAYCSIGKYLSNHVGVIHQVVRDHVSNGNIILQYVSTNLLKADIFTKNLHRVKFTQLMKGSNMESNKHKICVEEHFCSISSVEQRGDTNYTAKLDHVADKHHTVNSKYVVTLIIHIMWHDDEMHTDFDQSNGI